MIAFLTSLFTLLPQLISLGKTIFQWIQQEEELSAKKKLLNDFHDGIKTSISSGDTSSLENIFRSGNQ